MAQLRHVPRFSGKNIDYSVWLCGVLSYLSDNQIRKPAMTNPFSRYPRVLARLPRLIRIYIFHSLVGFGLAACLTLAVLISDFAGIGSLVRTVSGGWLAAFVFFFLNGTVFAGVQSSIAIMGLGKDEDQGGRRPPMLSAAIPVRVAEQRR